MSGGASRSDSVDPRKLEAALKKRKGKKTSRRWSSYVPWICAVLGMVVAGVYFRVRFPPRYLAERLVNDDAHISQINRGARGAFKAAASPFFENWSLSHTKIFGSRVITSADMRGSTCPFLLSADELPEAFDSRTKWKDCFAANSILVREGGNCTNSWAISGASTASNRFCIVEPQKHKKLNLSPQHLLSCDRRNGGCDGGSLDIMWKFMQTDGLVSENCFPFEYDTRGVSCQKKCKEETPLVIQDSCTAKSVEEIKRELVRGGPMVAFLVLYTDIFVYSSGVYEPHATSSKLLDKLHRVVLHPIKIIGWGQARAKQFWIIENTWGEEWGESGYANVAMVNRQDSTSLIHLDTAFAPIPISEKTVEADAAFEDGDSDE